MAVMAGWVSHSQLLVRLFVGFAPTEFNAALSFFILGVALVVLTHGHVRLAVGLTALVALFSAAFCVEHAAQLNLGIDQLFISPFVGLEAPHPGRMAPMTALGLLLTAASLLLVSSRRARNAALLSGAIAASMALAIALVTLLGYATDVRLSSVFAEYSRMSQSVAGLLVAITVSILALIWKRSESTVAMRWLPLTLGISLLLVLGFVTLQAQSEFQNGAVRRLAGSQIRSGLIELELLVVETQDGGRGYGLSGIPRLQALYETGRAQTPKRLAAIKALMDERQRRSPSVEALSTSLADLFAWYDRLHAVRAHDGAAAAVALVDSGEGEALRARFKSRAEALVNDIEHTNGDVAFTGQWHNLQVLRMTAGVVMLVLVVGTGWLARRQLHARLESETELRRVSTEQKRLEEEILTAAARLKMATESAGIGVWDLNLIDQTLQWDDGMYRLYGVRAEDFGSVATAWLQLVMPEDRSGVITAFTQAVDARERLDTRFRIVRRNGAVRHIRAHGVVQCDDSGRPVRMVGTNWDVTERLQAAEEVKAEKNLLRQMIRHTPAAVAMLDTELRYIQTSERWLVDYHLQEQDIIGKSHYEVFPDLPERWKAIYDRALAGSVERCEEDLFHRADGTTEWLQWEVRPWHRASGEIGGVVLFTQVVTARKRADEALREMAFRAEAASRAKSGFLAAMSHEIRTPMNGVLGFTNLLLDTPLRDDQRDYVQTIRSSGETLLHVINDILDFSKIEADRLELEQVTFELGPSLEECVKLLQPKATEKHLDLDVVIDDRLPARVVGDCGRIRQIVLNLLSNAIKFTHQGSVRLTAAHLSTAHGQARIAIAVSDTGIGIPDDKLARLFRPFTQVDASTSRNYGGSGLGLAICKRLAEAMGGTITVETTEGYGSTFTVSLALETVVATPGDIVAPAAPARAELVDARTPLTVLVAEDTAVNQRLILAFLDRLGYRADVVGDGVEALEILARRAYDVVLMDVHMPRLDGLDTTRRIRAELPPERQPHIIAVTASVMKEETEACARAGMDQFIGKPINPDALRDALARAAEQRAGRESLRKSA